MLETIRNFGQDGATLLLGLAVGAAWIVTIVAPNTSYDSLDATRADKHVRGLLKSASDPIAVVLLVAGGLAILGGALVSGVTAFLAAFGFFTNRWTLANFKRGETPPDAKEKRKAQRAIAVSLTLVFALVAAVAAVLAVLGI
ncbi:MAG: hypothetical protein NXH88_06340 [Hyphomonas sp.]|nr:hypothetical protein [Hyphomonas sp.]